uniref:SHSP domain-containing protein n=1 Tax=Daphnia galeata TaxID=27404 RepID=A0A8J2RU35_9CRUS|nr:unnamed protein product [Daphnia galeata]
MAGKNIIPVKLGDFSVLDSEFNSIRERFDSEMRKMEDEMTRFRSELLNREQSSSLFSRSSTSSSTTSSSTNSSMLPGMHMSEARKWIGDVKEQMTSQMSSLSSATSSHMHSALAAPASDWLTGLHSPLIQEDGEEKKLKLRFDVAQYTPEEIVVKTVDNKLLVHAKHEEKSETKSVYREYNREFLLPKGTNPELIRSSLSKDGVLTIEAPLPAIAAGEKMIPIAQH